MICEVNGIKLYYERIGSGTPILLIPGVGGGNWLWDGVRALSNRFDLIMPHLRGSGRSEKPDKPYSVKQFSDDICSLVNELGLDNLHVIGVSLGGFVAQQFTVDWKKNVKTLTLVCTSAGGRNQLGPRGDILSRMIRLRGKTKSERLMDAYRLNFTDDFMTNNPDEIKRITDWRVKYPQPEFAYYRQILAGAGFDGVNLELINRLPVLIIAGKDDPLVPLVDVRKLHSLLPNSMLKVFEGKHLFFFENNSRYSTLLENHFTYQEVGSE